MTEKPTILNLGMDVYHPDFVAALPNHAPPEAILKAIESTREEMHRLGYTDFKSVMLNPDQCIKEVDALLKERQWDAIILGGAFKLVPAYNTYLEDIIRMIRRDNPKSDILFAIGGPSGVLDAANRIKL